MRRLLFISLAAGLLTLLSGCAISPQQTAFTDIALEHETAMGNLILENQGKVVSIRDRLAVLSYLTSPTFISSAEDVSQAENKYRYKLNRLGCREESFSAGYVALESEVGHCLNHQLGDGTAYLLRTEERNLGSSHFRLVEIVSPDPVDQLIEPIKDTGIKTTETTSLYRNAWGTVVREPAGLYLVPGDVYDRLKQVRTAEEPRQKTMKAADKQAAVAKADEEAKKLLQKKVMTPTPVPQKHSVEEKTVSPGKNTDVFDVL